MSKIKCKMFGVPEISENDNTIYLPSGKVSSILYYILEKKIISRDELVAMFWPESNEKNAKNSLRNVIFKIRSAFESEIILTPNKSLILLNTKNVEFDLDTMKFEENPSLHSELNDGEYLEGINLSESISFQYWLDEKREYYKGLMAKVLREDIEKSLEDKRLDGIEQKIYKLISMDEFDESAYLLLFDYFTSIERYDKVINEYHKVQRLFQNELGIELGDEFRKTYEHSLEIISSTNKKTTGHKDDIIERHEETTIINHMIDRFLLGENDQHIAVIAEKGVGKTYLTRNIINSFSDKLITFRVNCYKVESEIAYSSVRTLAYEINKIVNADEGERSLNKLELEKGLWEMENTDAINPESTFDNSANINLTKLLSIIQKTLNELGKNNKIIIYIDDINNADDYSLDFYTNMMLHLNSNVKFLVTLEYNNKKLNNTLNSMKAIDKIKLIELSSYTIEQVQTIVKNNLNLKRNIDSITEDIYEKSKGNPLFVNELISNYKNSNKILITEKIYDLLMEKFSSYTQDTMDILRLISMFYYPVSYELVLKLSKEDPFKIINTLNILINDGVLEEINDKEIQLRFYNSAYREYVYGTLKESSKLMLHKTVASMLEKEMPLNKKSVKSLINIKNQYDLAKDSINSLKFEVFILDYHLSYTHEVFPTLEAFSTPDVVESRINTMNLMETFRDISSRINYLKNITESVEGLSNLSKVEQVYEFCKGRYLIRQGEYIEGIESINKTLLLAKENDNKKLIIDAYKQLIIQGIQIDSPEIMIKSIVPAIRIAKKSSDYEELSILYRLFGLYRFMIGNTEEAKLLLNNSIRLLDDNVGFKNNSINKAASLNYMGEIMHSEGNFQEAKNYFEQAIELCSKTNAISSAVFYLNLGRTNYFLNDLSDMKRNFESAKKYYDEYDIFWKKPVLDSFLALIAFKEKNYEKTVNYLKKAAIDGKLINNERDLGIFYFVESLIIKEINEGNIKNETLEKYFNISHKVYKFNALQYLDAIRDKYEIQYLQEVI